MNLVPPGLGENMPAQQKKLSDEEDREYKVKYRELKRTLKKCCEQEWVPEKWATAQSEKVTGDLWFGGL